MWLKPRWKSVQPLFLLTSWPSWPSWLPSWLSLLSLPFWCSFRSCGFLCFHRRHGFGFHGRLHRHGREFIVPENVAEAMLEVGATTVRSYFLAFMAFLAAFMAFIAFVAVFGAASELRLSLLSSPSWLWVSWPPSSPWQRIQIP